MSWLQLKLTVSGEFADELSDFCLQLGAVSAMIDNAGTDSLAGAVLEPGPGETIVWERAAITAFWEASGDLQHISRELTRKMHDSGIFSEVEVNFRSETGLPSPAPQPVAELSFGAGRLWLVPRDVTSARRQTLGDAAQLLLDPGLAFGSGLHPTTQLCLDYLARLTRLRGARLLDFGCGSGVLALGGLALGARVAHGVDHDPQALVATLDNAAYNDLADGMQVFMPSELPAAARYEVVVANILANPLIELAPELSDRLLAGGTLVLAGLLAQQADQVMQAYPAIQFDPPVPYHGSAVAISAGAAEAAAPIGGRVVNADEDWVRLQGVKTSG